MLRLNSKQEQIMLYLYEFKNTPERGVGPDLRLTLQGITEGTQIIQSDVRSQLEKLVSKAFIRGVLIGRNTFYYLTMKGYCEIEKVHHRTLKLGFGNKGLDLEFKKSETKGTRN
jgi:hypothetical protein